MVKALCRYSVWTASGGQPSHTERPLAVLSPPRCLYLDALVTYRVWMSALQQRHPSANGRPPHQTQWAVGRRQHKRRHGERPPDIMARDDDAARSTAVQHGHRTAKPIARMRSSAPSIRYRAWSTSSRRGAAILVARRGRHMENTAARRRSSVPSTRNRAWSMSSTRGAAIQVARRGVRMEKTAARSMNFAPSMRYRACPTWSAGGATTQVARRHLHTEMTAARRRSSVSSTASQG
ncbi:unnamed protein product [Ectocarpus sp. 13 AM-2016]